ncbi:environmental stress-induced protein Ves [Streptacidiphilus sp. MAP12-16]|uniref:HutD/Ves family protein n=1 Tax=Streptacidiphilus sp. MAP12-16 TaxID=3156300 RepID=UPI003518C9ED
MAAGGGVPAARRIRVLPAADRAASAWKNGGGTTREVAAGPDGAGLDDFDWRVSLADVAEGGPFSRFPGVDRVITVVEGNGMELTVDGRPHPVDRRYQPFAFAGDADTGCRLLDGPIVDFNVMTRRDRVRATVAIVRDDLALPSEGTVLVLLLDGRARLDDSDLDQYDAALLDGPGSTSLVLNGGAGLAAVVTLRQATRA